MTGSRLGNYFKVLQAEPERWFDVLFWSGLYLRWIVFFYLCPFNNDSLGHYEHILYVAQHWSMPPAGLGHETFQPPLYYFLSALMAMVGQDAKFLQLFSLATSMGALWIFRRMIRSDTFLKTLEGKLLAFAIVAFLPQFVMFGLYISNDSLAVCLGFAAFWQAERHADRPDARNLVKLAGVLTLGLLTKGQFIVISAILFPWACLRCWPMQKPLISKVATCIALTVMLAGIGGIKYEQNYFLYKKPFVSNIDFKPSWVPLQQGSYKGLASIYDVNIVKLLKTPTLDQTTRHSIPLLLYATTWYQYIPESSFKGNLEAGPRWIGRFQYLVGILPTALLAIGCFTMAAMLWRAFLLGWKGVGAPELLGLCAALAFVGNVVLLLHEFALTDVWSILQGRLLFPTILGAMILCDLGASALARRMGAQQFRALLNVWICLLLAGSVAYFGVEIALHPTRFLFDCARLAPPSQPFLAAYEAVSVCV